MLQLPRAARVLVVCVVGLLAANAAVVVTRLGDDLLDPAVAIDAPPEVAVVDDTVVREVVIITSGDGRQVAVDPSTPEGQAAIADAIARGDDVQTRTVSLPAPDRAGREAGDSRVDGSQAGVPLSQSVLDAVLKGGDDGVVLVSPTTAGASGSGGGLPVSTTVPGTPLDDVLDEVDDVVGGVVDEVNGVVEDTRRTVNDVIEDVTDAVDDVTDGTTVSVPGVPVTVTTPPVTTAPVTVTVTTPPVTVPVATTVVTVPPVTTTVTVPPVTVTVPPVTVPPVTVATTVPCSVLC